MTHYQFDQLRPAAGERLAQCAAELIVVAGPGVAQTEGQGGVFKADLLRRAPTLFEFRQGGLGQEVENAAATVVDRDDDSIVPGGERQAAQVVLGAQVAKQGDDPAMGGGNAEGGRDVAIDAAGAAVAMEVQGFVTTPGMGVELADDVLNFLAQRIRTNVRRLEGALVRVTSFTASRPT